MVNYENGKIYKIVCNKTGKVYVGSTTNHILSDRLSNHVSSYKRWLLDKKHYVSSYEIFQENNYFILLIENYPCKSKDELRAREQYHIDYNECVNMRKSLITKEQKIEYNKNWINKNYDTHKDNYNKQRRNKRDNDEKYKNIVSERNNKYYKNNKQKCDEINKIYFESNKDKIKEYQKQYRQRNKDKLKEYMEQYRIINKPNVI